MFCCFFVFQLVFTHCSILHGCITNWHLWICVWPWLCLVSLACWKSVGHFLGSFSYQRGPPVGTLSSNPICSMYGIFTNICPKNQPNVGKYSIHGAYGNVFKVLSARHCYDNAMICFCIAFRVGFSPHLFCGSSNNFCGHHVTIHFWGHWKVYYFRKLF